MVSGPPILIITIAVFGLEFDDKLRTAPINLGLILTGSIFTI